MSVKNQKKKVVKSSSSKKKWLPIFILVISSFLYYGNTLKNGFSLDDDLVTSTDNSVHERVEKGFAGIPEIFRTRYVETSKQSYDYRPITTTTFAIQYQFFGDKSDASRAQISHLINLMLYILIIISVYLLFYRLLPEGDWKIPFVIAFLFLLHPIHSEVVNNIKCRDELLVMLFGLNSGRMMLRFVDSQYKSWLSLLFAILLIVFAVLSKRTALIFVVNIPLMLYFFRDVKLKVLAGFFSVLLIGIFVLFFLKKTGISTESVREKMFFENPLYFADSFSERIPMFFYSMMFYLKMMFAPYPLRYYYGYSQVEIADWSNPVVWIGVIIVTGLSLFAFYKIKKKQPWAFGVLFYMFGIGGACNLLTPNVGIFAERFAFVASLGFVFVFGYYGVTYFEKWKKSKYKLIVPSLSVIVILTSFTQTVNRNPDWKSRFSLYHNDIKDLPKSAKAHSLLGTEYTRIADSIVRQPNSSYGAYVSYIDSAIIEFSKCFEIYDGYYTAANNAGALYFTRKNNHYKAKPLFEYAIKHDTDYVEALFNYGNCFSNDLKGVRELQRILKKNAVDTIAPQYLIDESNFEPEIKAGFAILLIKNEVRQSLSNVDLNNSNWRELLKYQIMLSFKTHSEVEEGILLRDFKTNEFESVLLKSIQNINKENIQSKLQELMYYIENSLEQVIVNYVFEQVTVDREYLDKIYFGLVKKGDLLFSTSELHWYKALEVDPTYYYSYKKLIDLYLVEERYDELLKISTTAINEGGFENNSEFYLNVGNVYNSKGDYPNAIINMKMAVDEVDKIYASIYANVTMDPIRKQKQLSGLLNQKKQIYNFIANIYYTSGDMTNATYYQGLMQGI